MAKSIVESLSKAVVDLTVKEPIRVLHVDDEAGFLKSAKPCLEMQGAFQVETASSVEEALEKLKKKTFDAVISDYVMPGKDGLQFLKELREEGNSVPFIIFTGKGKEEVAIKALNLGADRYLNKTGYPETVYGELAYSIRKSVKAKQAEEAVRESQQKFERLFMSNPEAAVYLGPDFHILDINSNFKELFGYSLDEVKGKHINDVVVPKDRMEEAEILDDEAKKGYTYHDTVRKRKDGTLVQVSMSAAPITVEGQMVGSVGLYKDITQRKQMEATLRQSEEKYRNLFENAMDVTLTLDSKGKITSINKAAVKYGFRKDEIIGKNMLKFVSKKYWSKLLKDRIQLARRKIVEGNVEISTPKGNVCMQYWSTPIIVGNEVVGAQTILKDITERKQSEKALRTSESYLETILNSIFSGVVVIDEETHEIVDANPKALETIGASREQVIGKVCHSFICPADEGKCPISDLGQTVDRSERVLLRADGERIPILKTVTTTTWSGHKYMIESFIDITEYKRTKKELDKSEERFKTMMEEAPIGICNTDLKGKITYVNKRFEETTGYLREEIVGKNGFKLGIMSDETLKSLAKRMKERLTGKPSRLLEGRFKCKDGEWIWAEIEGRVIKRFGVPVGFQLAARGITERKKAEIALRESKEKLRNIFESANDCIFYVDKSGRIIDVNRKAVQLFGRSRKELFGRHFAKVGGIPLKEIPMIMKTFARCLAGKQHTLCVCIKDKRGQGIPLECSSSLVKADGKITGLLVIARDITERKKTEEESKRMMEELALINEKLGVVGKLARHDVRNKLSAVTNNIYLIKRMLTDDHKALEYLGDVESAVHQTERIFDFGRIYEKLGVEKLAYMDVEKTLKDATTLFSDLHGVKVVNDCRGLTVLADSLLRQLFYNLVDSSLKHGEKVSRIRVYYEESGRDKLKLVYEDDGVGIPKNEKEKIFTEGYGKGTGYGLYLIRKLCDVYGWTIRETGKPGKGTQFTITIPKMNERGKTAYQLH